MHIYKLSQNRAEVVSEINLFPSDEGFYPQPKVQHLTVFLSLCASLLISRSNSFFSGKLHGCSPCNIPWFWRPHPGVRRLPLSSVPSGKPLTYQLSFLMSALETEF